MAFRALIELPILRRIFAASWQPLVSAEESPPTEEYLGTLYVPMTPWENDVAIILICAYAIAGKSTADVGGFAQMSIRMLRRIASTVPVLLLFAVNAFGVNPNPRISISAGVLL